MDVRKYELICVHQCIYISVYICECIDCERDSDFGCSSTD